jgi:co-chaperonin GroES (HSP10)
MKPDKDLFSANMNTVELDEKKVLVRPSQVESTKGKGIIIGEERQLRMIRPKNLEIGRWKKNERSKPRSHPKATFDIHMDKYRDGKADIRGHENQTIQFSWIRPILLR